MQIQRCSLTADVSTGSSQPMNWAATHPVTETTTCLPNPVSFSSWAHSQTVLPAPPPFAGDGGLRLSPGRWHVCGSKVCHFQTRPVQSAMLCDHYTRTIPRIQRMTEPQEGRSRDPGVSPRTRITWRCGVITVRPPSESETRRP